MSKRRKPRPPKIVKMWVRVPASLITQLDRIAHAQGRSRTNLLGRLLVAALDRWKAENIESALSR